MWNHHLNWTFPRMPHVQMENQCLRNWATFKILYIPGFVDIFFLFDPVTGWQPVFVGKNCQFQERSIVQGQVKVSFNTQVVISQRLQIIHNIPSPTLVASYNVERFFFHQVYSQLSFTMLVQMVEWLVFLFVSFGSVKVLKKRPLKLVMDHSLWHKNHFGSLRFGIRFCFFQKNVWSVAPELAIIFCKQKCRHWWGPYNHKISRVISSQLIEC